MDNLLSGLIASKTRIKLLIRLFFNPQAKSYLRELAKEFDVSTNSVREELNQLTKTDLLKSEKNGRQIYYMANTKHSLFPELKSMVSKVMGIDQVIDSIVMRLGDLERAYLIDDYAEGKDTGIIDLLLVGDIDEYHLNDLSRKTERYIKRKIRSLVLGKDEFESFHAKMKNRPWLLIWEAKKHSGIGKPLKKPIALHS
ncbi:MAG TPA: ArsR family transcriptional regulator [Desulfobacterales bacterium]|nr:ArsR family transcriptional regulator [Desulfobacterales bacterium]